MTRERQENNIRGKVEEGKRVVWVLKFVRFSLLIFGSAIEKWVFSILKEYD